MEKKQKDMNDIFPKVYVAGKLNAMAVDYLKNVSAMIKKSEEIRKLGFSVFVPCVDLLRGIVSGDFEYGDYFYNNVSWLRCSDAIYVMDNFETSQGTKEEIAIAQSCGIPVFYDIESLKKIKENKNEGNEV